MAPDNAGPSTVTVERSYLETLVRRAQFNSSDASQLQSTPVDSVTVSRTELQALQRAARQYENLRRNLLRGGVVDETIALLSQDDAVIQDGLVSQESSDARDMPSISRPQPKNAPPGLPQIPTGMNRRSVAGNGHSFQQNHGPATRYQENDLLEADPVQDETSCSVDTPADEAGSRVYHDQPAATSFGGDVGGTRPQYERQSTRTLLLANLPDGTTHADITRVVRGGQLLDIFLRTHDRSATVSFLHAADARAFHDHARRHDLYINNKRVEVRWHDRQFILPGHVASKIGIGATRNLVVRRCDPRVTEESIRDDLEHIHNLVVVRVEFAGGSCFISTNSVHNAMFARTCMMSRFKYKGSKIEWDADECAQPLHTVQPIKPRREPPAPKKPLSSVANRFRLLNLDDGDDDDEDEVAADFSRAKEPFGIVA